MQAPHGKRSKPLIEQTIICKRTNLGEMLVHYMCAIGSFIHSHLLRKLVYTLKCAHLVTFYVAM